MPRLSGYMPSGCATDCATDWRTPPPDIGQQNAVQVGSLNGGIDKENAGSNSKNKASIWERIEAIANAFDPAWIGLDAAALAVVIDLADDVLGDPDIELNGDELDTSFNPKHPDDAEYDPAENDYPEYRCYNVTPQAMGGRP